MSTRQKSVITIYFSLVFFLLVQQVGFASTIVSVGLNNRGQTNSPPDSNYIRIVSSCSADHSIAIKSDGSLVAWGWNFNGQCNVPTGNGYIDVAMTQSTSFALRSNGSIRRWGETRWNPPPSGSNYIAITAHSKQAGTIIRSDGSLKGWGPNTRGVRDVPQGNDFIAISGGPSHCFALDSNGLIFAWGDNRSGQCNSPIGTDFISIAAGGSHGLALHSDGSLEAWGSNKYGQCDVPSGNDFIDIATGINHSMALRRDGLVELWGANACGQLELPDNEVYVQIAAGRLHSVALVPEPALAVNVDIKPLSCPNPVNVKSSGVLPVAILGSEAFDVNTIDVASIELAGVGAVRHSLEDVASPVSDINDCNCTEDGPDGSVDLTLKFKTQDIVEAIGEVNDGDILPLELTGVLFGERPIEGHDCIVVRGRHKPFNRADINKDGKVDLTDFAMFSQEWLQSSVIE